VSSSYDRAQDKIREPTRRLFFALWPDEAVRAAFFHATRKAARASGGRPVPSPNLHATLLFLGSVVESRVPDLMTIGVRVAATSGTQAGQLVFDRIEFWDKARVLVATASAAYASVSALSDILQEQNLKSSGSVRFDITRAFRPHVTLARKVHRPPRFMEMEAVTWSFADFALVESKTLPEGSVYTVLERFPLSRPQT
jgi:2'-5' RNA ligase